MPLTVRRAAPSDYDGLVELFRQVDQLHYEVLSQVLRGAALPDRSVGFIAGILDDANATILTAEEGGAVVGLAYVVEVSAGSGPGAVPDRYAYVRDLVVHERHRGGGIGRALMQAVHRWARERGLDQVRLMVWEFNQPALAFYQALGYDTLNRNMVKRLETG